MPGMRLSLPGAFKNIAKAIPVAYRDQYACVLEEIERHLRETIRGEHTLAEFAEHYCLDDEIKRDGDQPSAASGT